eukprot:GHVR01080881.1.p1 GENE.GHVR01080881.1~~GHVR01080881.1.p1  ORF type:complete len:507 (+),score=95.94 GHVR01080881.1:124-1644(+)
MKLLLSLSEQVQLSENITDMLAGKKVNNTENRSALHVALRSPADAKIEVDGVNVVPEVHRVLQRIKRFTEGVRRGDLVGFTGKTLKDVICIGIGGSYLGPEFVFESLRTDKEACEAAQGRRLRFLANVDPIDVKRCLEGYQAETTLVVIVSKTFTTAETMLNAHTIKQWLLQSLKSEAAVSKHMCAVSTNLTATAQIGIAADNVFGFWNWVGGRFSVCSAVGVVPLALQYGWSVVMKFLEGCHAMDKHFASAPAMNNLPIIMGLLGVWNSSFLKYEANALLPYCQALLRFPAHVQQVSMESNGKGVSTDGCVLPYPTEQIIFGEPGTNSQHSFFQLLHQGRPVPCEFIGVCHSQNPLTTHGEVSNHDELMSNFFAQPDALAFGKSSKDVMEEGVPPELVPHKTFPGDRPSLSLLLPTLDAYYCGCLLALYEHRCVVQGFMWGVNSFDQWGVELGKVLAKSVRSFIGAARKKDMRQLDNFCTPTQRLLKKYIEESERTQVLKSRRSS